MTAPSKGPSSPVAGPLLDSKAFATLAASAGG